MVSDKNLWFSDDKFVVSEEKIQISVKIFGDSVEYFRFTMKFAS